MAYLVRNKASGVVCGVTEENFKYLTERKKGTYEPYTPPPPPPVKPPARKRASRKTPKTEG